MAEPRYGRQTPTASVVIPYEATLGERAIGLYELTGRAPQEWQEALVYDIRATDTEGLFIHSKFGYEVPRRNGKGEIITIIELDDLFAGRRTLHTAHRTTTSSSASLRLATLLKDMGYQEIQRISRDETYDKAYTYSKQFGLERIRLLDTGGSVDFRTRTSKGGLGEGFDTLIIDEAQEYTDDQQSSLQYVVTDSMNPQTILCGTPPTMVSSGTIFQKLREQCLAGQTEDTGWAEWSTEYLADVNDVDLWYETNPAMGFQLNERKIRAEDKSDELDFNIQRLGYWSKHNLKSDITATEWERIRIKEIPNISERLFVGIKFTASNVSMSVAVKTDEGKVFFEAIDCQPIRNGTYWMVSKLLKMKPEVIVIDGRGAQDILKSELEEQKVKGVMLPTVKEVVIANAKFEQMLYAGEICHNNQPSLTQVATNCEKRAIGSGGGFGYKAQFETMEIGLLESAILAIWQCSESKEKKRQRISY